MSSKANSDVPRTDKFTIPRWLSRTLVAGLVGTACWLTVTRKPQAVVGGPVPAEKSSAARDTSGSVTEANTPHPTTGRTATEPPPPTLATGAPAIVREAPQREVAQGILESGPTMTLTARIAPPPPPLKPGETIAPALPTAQPEVVLPAPGLGPPADKVFGGPEGINEIHINPAPRIK